MSYDLYFLSIDSQAKISKESIRNYFTGRRNYEVSDTQAWYSNETTGVYFSFEYGDRETDGDDSEEKDPTSDAEASFNLNYYRPHIFGLEAEPEVSSFVDSFKMSVIDPQTDGMGEGAYSKEGFLQGWNHGNEYGYRAILSQEGEASIPNTLPSSVIESIWQWNYGVSCFQQELGENIFVPRVMHIKIEDRVKTMAVWPDAISIALPEVDYLIMLRKEYAVRKWLKREEDNVFVPFQSARALLGTYKSGSKGLRYWLLDFQVPPKDIVCWLQSHPTFAGKLEGLAVDSVLNEELVRKAKGT